MVIGGNVDEQLSKYDENKSLETPVVTGDVSEEEKNSIIEFYKKPENGGLEYPTFDELYAEKGKDWNDNLYEKRDDKWVKISTYNPHSKWDWYELGGRWNGFLKLKEGTQGNNCRRSWANRDCEAGHCDETNKKNIDVEGMRDSAGVNAGEYYDKVMTYIKDTPIPTKWSVFRERLINNEINVDEARSLYHNQPRLKAVSTEEARKELGWFIEIDDFDISREEYIQRARNKALSTHAIVKNGEWYQQGEMGWWGMSTDEMTDDEWDKKVTEMFDELPDDTLISIIDCHI